MQNEIVIKDSYSPIASFFDSLNAEKIFLVCDASYNFLKVSGFFDSMRNVVKFSDFTPNPDYESVKKAVKLYKSENCDIIVALGGGSAIDLAKCVKLYATMDDSEEYINQPFVENDIKLIAMPTTAGTGSEATRYAVIYYKGAKQSVTHDSIIPSTVIFDASVLKTLPEYQKKATMLDALCHSFESFWSVNSTEESKEYSKQAIKIITENLKAYLSNETLANENMLKAANIAGKAINITQTTAGHAMCYKLTSLYGIAHGHAAAMCVRKLLPYMIANTDKCVDARGEEYLKETFEQLANTFNCGSTSELCDKFNALYESLKLQTPEHTDSDIEVLTNSVNPVRLKNNPVGLDLDAIKMLYKQILE